jgi:hypothetical protein
MLSLNLRELNIYEGTALSQSADLLKAAAAQQAPHSTTSRDVALGHALPRELKCYLVSEFR